MVLANRQFEPLHGDIAGMGAMLNMTSHDEHIPEVERYIHTLKECMRSIYNTLQIKKYPKCLLIELVYMQNVCLNVLPHPDGISKVQSPKELIMSFRVEFAHHCNLEFSEFMHMHKEHSNRIEPCTVGALAL